MSEYKSFLLRQLGIRESQIKPSTVDRDAFPGIDPEELEAGTEDEKEEHGMSPDKAKQTAAQHLTAPKQAHYYSGMEKAKDAGMLKDASAMNSPMMSPTAIATPVIGIAVRGSVTGGLPSGKEMKAPGKLGGYEPIPTATQNSQLVDKTPANPAINSSQPISNGSEAGGDTHPHQVQNNDGEAPQNVTGASTDSDSALTLKSAMPQGMDIDVTEEEEDKIQNELNEGKHKSGCKCGFCMNKNRFGKKSKDGDESTNKNKKKDETDEKENTKDEDEKVPTERLEEIRKTLQPKAVSGKMNQKERDLLYTIKEVLTKRQNSGEQRMFTTPKDNPYGRMVYNSK